MPGNFSSSLSDVNIIQLITNCPHLKSLEVNSYHVSPRYLAAVFFRTIDCYNKLEVLKIVAIEISDSDFKLLSTTCHQLKVIDFNETNIRGIETLLVNNKNLLELNILCEDYDLNVGNVLEVLGLYCPLLQKCSLSFAKIIKYVTNTQIEIFTKGCQYLKCLWKD